MNSQPTSQHVNNLINIFSLFMKFINLKFQMVWMVLAFVAYNLPLSVSIVCIHTINFVLGKVKLLIPCYTIWKLPLCILSYNEDICSTYGLANSSSYNSTPIRPLCFVASHLG